MFSLDTTDFFKQMKEKNEDLNKFCFNNLKLSFYFDDTQEREETQTFLNELCDLKARDVDLDIFFINQHITTGEYSLLKEEYEEDEPNDNIQYFSKTRKEEEVINNYESFKSDECVICYNEKPDILFCNCGHIAICAKCEKLTKNNKCPICRKQNTIKRKIDY